MKITFKKGKRNTGLYAIGTPYQHGEIKVDGKRVGLINPGNWQRPGYTFQIAVKKQAPDGNPNCDWRWLMNKGIYNNETDARESAKAAIAKIVADGYTLHKLDDV